MINFFLTTFSLITASIFFHIVFDLEIFECPPVEVGYDLYFDQEVELIKDFEVDYGNPYWLHKNKSKAVKIENYKIQTFNQIEELSGRLFTRNSCDFVEDRAKIYSSEINISLINGGKISTFVEDNNKYFKINLSENTQEFTVLLDYDGNFKTQQTYKIEYL